jgi:hypothetical protein
LIGRRGKPLSDVEVHFVHLKMRVGVTSRRCGDYDWDTEEAYSGVRVDGLIITSSDTALKAIAVS